MELAREAGFSCTTRRDLAGIERAARLDAMQINIWQNARMGLSTWRAG